MQRKQADYDKKLLLKYGSLAELRRAQDRKMSELDSKVQVLNTNLSAIKGQIEAEQQKSCQL